MKISARLTSGVGNRLFQYASIKGIAASLNCDFEIGQVEYDSAHRKNYTWFLDRISKYINTSPEESIYKYEQPYNEHVGVVSHVNMDHNAKILVMHGYFQHEDYFFSIADDIRYELRISETVKSKIETYCKPIGKPLIDVYAIHFRLGDYIHCGKHFVNLMSYYKKCINNIRENKINNESLNFLIVCEDPQNIEFMYPGLLSFIKEAGCIHLFNINDNEYGRDELDLYVLTLCKGVICSNSTYAWWGAWINSVPDKKIFIPSKWLQDRNQIINMKGAIVVDV